MTQSQMTELFQTTQQMLENQIINIEQIHTLEKLRNNLLPKLMSGEVRAAQDT